ncbi:hypothetical protein [Nitratidesulfovibrio sp. SRB-5]|uniref:hypothetical protein n=1 Tax=Nitratidesulfovibrio sp. SRB-5 TaxID=2872636 RepID=UPI0010276663|nr:hypothetical protein [Nitratidesulfovibrio sp. SRB-5]MBZ2173283.1 hypothetical protein [Nitratidesulfovibrio sp. SRB-5]RXF77849.1 hypothetical protein EKK70_04660 [Desulfovibrio sp. DS-1]
MSLNMTLGALRAQNGLSPYGEGLGALLGTSVGSGTGAGARASGLSPDKTADVFGADIVRRTSVVPAAAATADTADTNTDVTTGAASTAPTDAERDALSGALSGSVRWVADKFGDAAATAVMGIVYKSVGDGPVTEDSLGEGLLNALRFVDRQFGTASGDAFMAQLNGGGLNNALNDYFDNGLSERFMVAGAGNLADDAVQGAETAKATLVQQAADGDGDGGADAMKSLLDMLRKMGVEDATENGVAPGGASGTASGTTADSMTSLLSGALSSLSGLSGFTGQAGSRTGGLAAGYGPTGAAAESASPLAPGLLLHASV